MTYKALIIEDDLQIIDVIIDALASLEHEHDTACSQSEALKRLRAGEYSYVLLDIEIPARTQTGTPRIQNTENLLEKIAEIKDGDAPPVIILSDYAAQGLDATEDVMRLAMLLTAKGAADIIKKPFPTAGRTLDRVIKKVLGLNGRPRRKRRRRSAKTKASRRVPLSKKDGSPDRAKISDQKCDTPDIKGGRQFPVAWPTSVAQGKIAGGKHVPPHLCVLVKAS